MISSKCLSLVAAQLLTLVLAPCTEAQMMDIGLPYGADSGSGARVSGDGSTVFARFFGPSGGSWYRWNAITGFEQIPIPVDADIFVSQDGSLLVGSFFDSNRFRWTAESGVQELPISGTIRDLTPDGKVVLGDAAADFDSRIPYRYHLQTGTLERYPVEIIAPFNIEVGLRYGNALAISGDANTFLGLSAHITQEGGADGGTMWGNHYVRWNKDSGYKQYYEGKEYQDFNFSVYSGSASWNGDFCAIGGDYYSSGIFHKFSNGVWVATSRLGDKCAGNVGGTAASSRAALRSSDGGVQILGELGSQSWATDISSEGDTIVGDFVKGGKSACFIWGVDRDGDGLFDEWEENGIDIDGDGKPEIDLKKMGANPDKKDIFVEVDAMSGQAPSASSMQMVKNAFAIAPVYGSKDEADKRGINLHILQDGDQSLPVRDFIPIGTSTKGVFDQLQAYLVQRNCVGTAEMRANPLWRSKLRQVWLRVFRYCLFIKRFWNPEEITWDTSGLAPIPGNFFIVSLGTTDWADEFRSVNNNKDRYYAGTFMHELGHTLGLRHGGSDDLNNKPNYLSVMNYLWQMPKEAYQWDWRLDYSRRAFNELNEQELNERLGIGGRPGAKVPISVGTRGLRVLVDESGYVDFDNQNDTDLELVGANVNGDNRIDTLMSQEDWSKLTYRSYGPAWEQDVSYGDSASNCMDYETYVSLARGGVNGKLVLSGYTASTRGKKLQVEVWKDGAKVETFSTIMGDSNLYLVSPSSTGAVTVKFQLLTGLVKAVNTTLGGAPVLDVNITLTNGDCDGDNYIGTDDYLIVSNAFDLSTGDPVYDSRADLNGDGYVGTDDYLILNENFDKSGD